MAVPDVRRATAGSAPAAEKTDHEPEGGPERQPAAPVEESSDRSIDSLRNEKDGAGPVAGVDRSRNQGSNARLFEVDLVRQECPCHALADRQVTRDPGAKTAEAYRD